MEKALLSLGLNKTSEFDSGKLMGTHYTQTFINAKDQTRSASDEYIRTALDNEKLAVYANTQAQKILFDGNKTATGVRVQSTAITYDIHASKEVIVSAGAFHSPQLLMVSGVGPKETLDKFDIDIIADRPGVGQNMWDHIMFGPAYEVALTPSTTHCTTRSRSPMRSPTTPSKAKVFSHPTSSSSSAGRSYPRSSARTSLSPPSRP